MKKKIYENPISCIVLLCTFFFLVAILANLSYGMIISATAKIEGEIIAFFDEPQPDEKDIPEILKVPYVAKIKVLRIIRSKENHSIYEIERKLKNNRQIPISKIQFKNPDWEKDLKEGDRFIGRLHLNATEYHHYGYKTAFF